MDGDDRILAIVLAAEHLLDLARLHFLIERVQTLGEVVFHGFAGIEPLGEDGEVVVLRAKREGQVAVLLHAPAALQDLLRLRLVLPEIGRGRLGFYAGEFFVGFGGFKDSYADRQRGG
jgi:hypothetical protein